MKHAFSLFVVLACLFSFSAAQDTWSVVWRLTQLPNLPAQTGSELAIVKAGFDTDQDGWGEFLCAWTDLSDNYILMYEASADNTYDLVWSWKYPYDASRANTFAGIAVGDIDNNSKVDIVTTMPAVADASTPNPDRLWVFEWSGVQGENKYGNEVGGEILPTASWNVNQLDNTDFRPYSLSIEDIDDDGSNELIMGVRQSESSATVRQVLVISVTGELSGFYSWNIEYNYKHDFDGALYSVTTGDLDNDGNQEICAFVWAQFTMRMFECTGDGLYTEVFSVDSLYKTQDIDYGAVDGVVVTDVNGDGVNEMYMAGTEDPNKIFILPGASDVSTLTGSDIKELFTIPVTGPSARGGFRSMQAADPDHDGNTDLMIAGEKNGQIFSLEYKGTGDPADSASWELHTLFDVWTYATLDPNTFNVDKPRYFYGSPAGDMDKDGKSEYVFVNYSTDFGNYTDDAYLYVIESPMASEVADRGTAIPERTALMQNYPNPFNPSTTIAYQLPSRCKVRLEVFNMYGQRVATLVDRVMDAGFQRAVWHASSPSGTYIYRLEAVSIDEPGKRFIDTKKMILVR